MRFDITSVQALGLLIRAACKTQRVRMHDLAGSADVGPVFVREVERGRDTLLLGRVLCRRPLDVRLRPRLTGPRSRGRLPDGAFRPCRVGRRPQHGSACSVGWSSTCWSATALAMPVGQTTRFATVRRSDLFDAADTLGLSTATAQRETDRLIAAVR